MCSPPTPNESCGGKAPSVNTNGATPGMMQFVATADEELGLASTIYATVLEYIRL